MNPYDPPKANCRVDPPRRTPFEVIGPIVAVGSAWGGTWLDRALDFGFYGLALWLGWMFTTLAIVMVSIAYDFQRKH